MSSKNADESLQISTILWPQWWTVIPTFKIDWSISKLKFFYLMTDSHSQIILFSILSMCLWMNYILHIIYYRMIRTQAHRNAYVYFDSDTMRVKEKILWTPHVYNKHKEIIFCIQKWVRYNRTGNIMSTLKETVMFELKKCYWFHSSTNESLLWKNGSSIVVFWGRKS